jgi:hypothetical protein
MNKIFGLAVRLSAPNADLSRGPDANRGANVAPAAFFVNERRVIFDGSLFMISVFLAW